MKKMMIFKQLYNLFRKYVSRHRSFQVNLLVPAFIEERSKVKTDDQDVGYRSESQTSKTSPLDINELNQQPEKRPVIEGYPASTANGAATHTTNQDIDSTGFSSLEGYAEGLSISEETIAKWVSAGILSPRETEIAEKVIRIMRNKARQGGSPRPFSPSDP